MKVYEGVIKTYEQGSIRLQAICNLKLKRGKTVTIIPDRPAMFHNTGSTQITSLISQEDSVKLSRVCNSSDHFGDFYIYMDGQIIGVVESCNLQDLEIHTSLVTGITNASFRLGLSGSRVPTKRERIECGINRLKKVE